MLNSADDVWDYTPKVFNETLCDPMRGSLLSGFWYRIIKP